MCMAPSALEPCNCIPHSHVHSIGIYVFDRYIPIGTIGMNKFDKPVIVNRLSAIDFTNLVAAVDMRNVIKHFVYLAERHTRHNPTGNSTLVFDVSVEYMSVATFTEVRQWITTFSLFVKKLSAIVDPFYPEMYREIIFCNAQKMFHVTWNVVKSFLASHTVSKVKILSADPLPTLLDLMDLTVIPDFLGGTNECIGEIGIGGPVPNPLTTDFIIEMKQAKQSKSNFRKSMMHPQKLDESISSAVLEDPNVPKTESDAVGTPGDRCVIV